ncbi:MAG: hypothetical protein KC435_03525 [Thermomicrobiales bacterium]|nr:hypothetical protein [Thermomicrobiales bacterium]
MMYWVWRFRFSLAVQIVIVTIGWLTLGHTPEQHAHLMNHVGLSWQLLTEGRIWHIFTGTWVQSKPGLGWNMISMCMMVALGTFPLEYRVGSRLTAITLIIADWFASTMAAVTLWMLAEFGRLSDPGVLHKPDAGTSALAWAGMAAGAVVFIPRLRWVLVPVVVGFVGWQFTIEPPAAAIAHAFAVGYGLTAGWLFLRTRSVQP